MHPASLHSIFHGIVDQDRAFYSGRRTAATQVLHLIRTLANPHPQRQ